VLAEEAQDDPVELIGLLEVREMGGVPPSETPTSAARSMPTASMAPRTAPLNETGFVSKGEFPKPGRSTRSTKCDLGKERS